MIASINSFRLLAQREAWESLGNRFSGEYTEIRWIDLATFVGVLACVVLFIAFLRWLYGRQLARELSNEPKHLFVDLCRAHRLCRRDRRLLRDLADFAGLDQHAYVFLRPDLFESKVLDDFNCKQQSKYTRLAEKLFAGLERLDSKTRLHGKVSNHSATTALAT